MTRDTCCRSSRARSRIGRRCSSKSSSGKAAAVSVKETSKRFLKRLSGNRRGEVTYNPRMKLCTFEVQTQVGRFRRVGAVISSGIVDLNFAMEAKLFAQGEPRPQDWAQTMVPSDMLTFLDAGECTRNAAAQALKYFEETHPLAG